MKALTYSKYGGPEVLEINDQDLPIPEEDQVLIKVHAASVNPLDWRRMRAEPFMVRFTSGLFKPKQAILGADIAGRVEAVGKEVTLFKVGDEVFGDVSVQGFAEFVCATEDQIAVKPASASFEQAAALPVAGLTALQALRDNVDQVQGRQILINGASGGVGSFAVQIATAWGGQVTGVCSTSNVEMVKKLGANHVIDYRKTDITQEKQRYDVLLDCVGNFTLSDMNRLLKPGGEAVVIGFKSMRNILHIALRGGKKANAKRPKVISMTAKARHHDLHALGQMLADGSIKPEIERSYPFSKVKDAISHVETGRTKGKVTIIDFP
ncbi:MAG: NAD(P)-dependent alcohol dehydrogenase [Bacteroidia bacterium]|nr:NAD(P)-dependent alcohol dehydrogenase [Bacteroidia bacterium]